MARTVLKRARLMSVHMPQGTQLSFQELLTTALQGVDLDDTALASASFGSLRLNRAPQQSLRGGLKLKIVGHAPGEKATTVPVELRNAEVFEDSAPPPELFAFQNCEFFAIVRDNLVLGFGDRIRMETAVAYLRALITNLTRVPSNAQISFTHVFAHDKAEQIQTEGVRSLEFAASLSAASMDSVEAIGYGGRVQRLAGGLAELLSATVGADPESAELADVHVGVTISVKGGVRGSALATRAVSNAASELLDDESVAAGVEWGIRTKKGNLISVNQSTIGRPYKLERRERENSLIELTAFEALEEFDAYVATLGDLKT